jgi:periplasmic mercuric ion binding protein
VIPDTYCESCAVGIKAMLKHTEGVTSAEVSYEKKEAVVDFDPATTSTEKIVEAITNLGYKATVKS